MRVLIAGAWVGGNAGAWFLDAAVWLTEQESNGLEMIGSAKITSTMPCGSP
jgi:hypothetical protein